MLLNFSATSSRILSPPSSKSKSEACIFIFGKEFLILGRVFKFRFGKSGSLLEKKLAVITCPFRKFFHSEYAYTFILSMSEGFNKTLMFLNKIAIIVNEILQFK